MSELPCFDDLIELANVNPEAFEQLRKDSCQAYIATTPSEHQSNLKVLQAKLDREIKSAKNPMEGIVKISMLMSESVYQLAEQLHKLNCAIPESSIPPAQSSKNIVSMEHWRSKKNHPS